MYTDFDLYSYFYGLVRQIPKGMITTYGGLARALGDIVSARACGYMLSINPDPVGTPCYKVVRSTGEVGKFTHPDGAAEKVRRLEGDGIIVRENMIQDFDISVFESFKTEYPLTGMKEEQERLAGLVKLEGVADFDRIAAVDVSYDDFTGYGAIVIQNGGDYEVRTAIMPVNFPYIPGYLSYREFRFIRELVGDFKGTLLIDANGYLHPRHAGLASFTGVMLDMNTIGVAKSLLTGKINDRLITIEGVASGYQLAKNTIVSAGNGISLESSVAFLKESYGEIYPPILKMAHNETVKLRKRGAELV